MGEASDETGLIVAALGEDNRTFVLDSTLVTGFLLLIGPVRRLKPHTYQADCLIAEINHGGDLVEKVIHSLDPNIAYKAVCATRGKWVRAEPIAALYGQGRVIHVRPFPELETQLISYAPHSISSPDRLDALVWALTELMPKRPQGLIPPPPHIWRV